MLLRERIRTSNGRVDVGLFGLATGILLQHFGPRLPGVADSPVLAGLIDGASVVLLALSIFLVVSGASARYRRR